MIHWINYSKLILWINYSTSRAILAQLRLRSPLQLSFRMIFANSLMWPCCLTMCIQPTTRIADTPEWEQSASSTATTTQQCTQTQPPTPTTTHFYDKLVYQNQVYNSTLYKRPTKSDTTFIETSEGFFRIEKNSVCPNKGGPHLLVFVPGSSVSGWNMLSYHIKPCFLSQTCASDPETLWYSVQLHFYWVYLGKKGLHLPHSKHNFNRNNIHSRS